MYERMLNKQVVPSKEELAEYCADTKPFFIQLNEWLSKQYGTEQEIVFPYGKKYGWGIAHKKKNKLICNIFAEANTFTIMLRLSNEQYDSVYKDLHAYAKQYIDHKYPCGNGGWIHYRVTCQKDVEDIETLLTVKCS